MERVRLVHNNSPFLLTGVSKFQGLCSCDTNYIPYSEIIFACKTLILIGVSSQ